MSDPTIPALLKTGVAAAALDFFGVDAAWLFAAFFGSLAVQAFGKDTISRMRAALQVVCSSVLGALIGGALAHLGEVRQPVVSQLLCAIGGFGTLPIMTTLIGLLQDRLGSAAGNKTEGQKNAE